jgi:site-specific recombinase XerD
LVLASGVLHLDPASAVFEGMLAGWALQQQTRFLKSDTITSRLRLVRRVTEFCNEYPWKWQPDDVEAFIAGCRDRQSPIVATTARLYETTLRMFLQYVTDPRYGWPAECVERFGVAPAQVLHEWNTIVHVGEYEADPRRRPLTYDEVQALFDAADGIADEIRGRGRKGVLGALRDAAVLKTIYAYGLRRREAWGLDVADLRYNPKIPAFGRYGGLFVRWGKSSRGSPPRRRTVLTVPEMDWIVSVLQQWCEEVRPAFGVGAQPALWVTERASRLSMRSINEAFATARDVAGLDPSLDLHCLRHSYITHLVEFDYPEKFVSTQAGHTYAATTAIYTGVCDEYRSRLLRRALGRHPEL